MDVAIVALPLVGAIIAGLGNRQLGDQAAMWITSGLMLISFVLSWIVFLQYDGTPRTTELFTWFASGTFEAKWAIRIDQLSAVMLVVVGTVSSMVHVYSIGYMGHDHSIPRFMAYLSLFTFCMLMLVTADNFMQMFFGWEGVGLCSYLLIGFWFHKPSANAAAIKAFIVNRIGDFGFALGIMGVFFIFGTVGFDAVFAATPGKVGQTFHFLSWDVDIVTTLCILLFIGAMGKSAQLGLHTWLPDAMEGPTPVSALIHAATMVTAGVFMVCRLSPMFEYAPTAMHVVTYVGAATCIFAATVGCAQNDIKRVIAYSTCSQLGYMFFAAGVGAYGAAMFHLGTHAFFKSLLFLAAGSVITALHEEQDMRNMGGLWRKLPITYAVMCIGALSLAAIPFFAGYYSKDFILETTFASHASFAHWAYWAGTLSAGLTALYIFRLIFLTFHGRFRGSDEAFAKIHESPLVMTIPLIVLAVGAAFGGMIGEVLIEPDMAIWDGSILVLPQNHVLEAAHHIPALAQLLPLILALLGIAIAYVMYILRPAWPAQVVARVQPLYVFLVHKWYFDELYDFLFVRPAKWLGYRLWQRGDLGVIDGYGPNGFAAVSVDIARRAIRLQTGYLYHYAFAMLIGVALFVTWYMFVIRG